MKIRLNYWTAFEGNVKNELIKWDKIWNVT